MSDSSFLRHVNLMCLSAPDFGHSAVHARSAVLRVKELGCGSDHESRRLQVCGEVRQRELNVLEVRELVSELLAHFDVVNGRVEAGLRASQCGGADVDAAAVQPFHRDGEARALGSQQIGSRHAAVLHDHTARRLRVPAQLALLRAEAQTGGGGRHNEAADAARAVCTRARHHQV